jgi:hypothetical protein
MNIYLEKIARTIRLGGKSNRKHGLVDTALDLKGRMDDMSSIHSQFKQDKKRKKK